MFLDLLGLFVFTSSSFTSEGVLGRVCLFLVHFEVLFLSEFIGPGGWRKHPDFCMLYYLFGCLFILILSSLFGVCM